MSPRWTSLVLAAGVGVAAALGAEPSLEVRLEDAASLTLRQALVLGLRASPELAVTRLDPEIAGATLRRERATWDPTLRAGYDVEDATEPLASSLQGVSVRRADTRNAEVGLVKPFATGETVEATVQDQRAATNSRSVRLNPSYASIVSVSYRRPLRRGFGRDVNRRDLSRAELDLESSRWELRQDVIDVLADTERAYWGLAAARERVDVATFSLEEARRLMDSSQVRVDAGTVAPITLLEAGAAVAERRDLRLVAERSLRLAHNEMLRRIRPPPRPGDLVPELTDPPGRDLPPPPDLEELVGDALRHAPAYRLALLDLQARRVDLRFAEDAVQPRLDLLATLTVNGLAAARHSSVDQLVSLDFDSYFVGVAWSMPLGNRAARSERDRTRLMAERAVRQVKLEEVNLEGAVVDAAARYEVDLRRTRVSQERVAAALAKLRAEEERFHEGFVTADDVVRFQRELAEAQSSEVSSRTQASISLLELWTVSGVLPGRRGVSLAAFEESLPEP